MRFIVAVVLGGALALVGCGSDGGGGSAASGGSGGSGGSAGSGGGDGSTPTITMVAWEATPDCARNTRSDVVVTVTATGSGTLVYSGSVFGCANPIDAAVSTISCPNVALYQGTVMVTDAGGNLSTAVAFDIDVCETDSCTTDPDTCTR
jgi:hypothetical protein